MTKLECPEVQTDRWDILAVILVIMHSAYSNLGESGIKVIHKRDM